MKSKRQVWGSISLIFRRINKGQSDLSRHLAISNCLYEHKTHIQPFQLQAAYIKLALVCHKQDEWEGRKEGAWFSADFYNNATQRRWHLVSRSLHHVWPLLQYVLHFHSLSQPHGRSFLQSQADVLTPVLLASRF